jgi:hypothetical protein
MGVTSKARVDTARPERYRKQLASHFGNKIEVATGRHLERFGEKDGLVVAWQQRAVPHPVRSR